MAGVQFTDNTEELLAALKEATQDALEMVAGKMEAYAVRNAQSVAPRSLVTEIANSIISDISDGVIRFGSNLQVAPYIELGTGPNYQPPPEWLQNEAEGGRGQAGLSHWIYWDPKDQRFKIGTPQEARPFIRPAIQDHIDEYRDVIERELKKDRD